MVVAACAATLLCLLSLSHSAPLACEELLRPVDPLDPRQLEGKWALVAGSLSHPPFLERFRQRDSAAVHFARNTSESNVSYTRSIRLGGECRFGTYNITLEGSSFSYDGRDGSNSSARFVSTSCRDCLLMHLTMESGKRQHFYMFSRRRQLEQSEMEEFRAQVGCLNLPPPAVMDPSKDLCPDGTSIPSSSNAEDKTGTQKD